MKNSLVIIAVLMVSFLGCKKEEKQDKVINDEIAFSIVDTLGKGDFVNTDAGHQLSGKAILFKDSTGNKILRLENLYFVNGPDVDLYLSKTNTYQDVIKIHEYPGPSVNTISGNINYDIDDAINTDEYDYVLVWCYQYSARFGYAQLVP